MKNVIVIGAYINTDEKETILYEALQQLRKLQLPIIVTSSSILSNRIIELCDYHIYDKENLLLPIERSPLYWYADSDETVHLYNRGISYTILRKMNLSLNFLHNLKFDNFFYMEYDNIIHDEDLVKITDMFTSLETKKAFFCRASDDWLESRIFAGNVDFFVKNLSMPTSYEEWISTEPYSSRHETLEILFSIVFRQHLNDVHLFTGFNKDYFANSKIDLFSISQEINIVYNNEQHDLPLLFLIGSGTEYTITVNDVLLDTLYLNVGEVKKYYINLINEVDSKITVERKGLCKSFVLNKHNIEDYKTMGCRYKL